MMNAEPQKEHQWLHKLVGEWTYESEAVMEPSAGQLLLSLGYGVDKNFKEIPRVAEVGGSIDVSFKLLGF